jgi:hypothetical protein
MATHWMAALTDRPKRLIQLLLRAAGGAAANRRPYFSAASSHGEPHPTCDRYLIFADERLTMFDTAPLSAGEACLI